MIDQWRCTNDTHTLSSYEVSRRAESNTVKQNMFCLMFCLTNPFSNHPCALLSRLLHELHNCASLGPKTSVNAVRTDTACIGCVHVRRVVALAP